MFPRHQTLLLPSALVITSSLPIAMAAPGDLVWEAPITGDGYACPAVASDGTIVFATHSNGGILYAIDPSDGTILRQSQLPGSVEHSVALGEDDTVYFNTVRNAIASGGQPFAVAAAWDFDSFTEIWRSMLDSGADTSPIIGTDRLYLGVVVNPMNGDVLSDCSEDGICGHYYSFDMTTGDRIIDKWVEGWAATPGVIDDENRVFFGVEDLTGGEPLDEALWPGRFYGIDGNDPESGTEPDELWTPYDALGDFGSPVSYAEGVVYSTCRDGHLYGFDAETGEIVFDRDMGTPSWGGTSIGRNPENDRLVLYTGTQFDGGTDDTDSKFLAIELDGTLDGELVWSANVPGGIGIGNPAIDDLGNIYTVSNSIVFAYDRDGTQLWTYQLPGWNDTDGRYSGGTGGPTILDDGTIVVSSNGGYIVAIEGNGNHLADDVPWPKYKHDLRATANIQTPIRHAPAADINGDGSVDTDDLLLLLAAWGSDDEDADLNGDGNVGVVDLMLILEFWS